MSELDPPTLHERLQSESARLLGFDADQLSVLQQLRVDLISCLRMAIDGQQSKLLAGGEGDIGRLLVAADALQKLLPHEVMPPVEGPGHPDSLGKLRELVNNRAAQLEYERDDELETLRAEVESLRAALRVKEPAQKLLPPPVQEPLLNPEPPKTSASPPTARPQKPLQTYDEPWRGHTGPDGPIAHGPRGGMWWGPI